MYIPIPQSQRNPSILVGYHFKKLLNNLKVWNAVKAPLYVDDFKEYGLLIPGSSVYLRS